MTVTVEFLGIPRLKTGLKHVEVQAGTVEEVLRQVAELSPEFLQTCLDEDFHLKSGFLASRNGRDFLSDASSLLEVNDTLIILSADVGG